MKKALAISEIAFWLVFFAAPAATIFLRGVSDSSIIYVLVLALFGAVLSGVNFVLRSRQRTKDWINLTISILWFVGYFLIGYPNLEGPGGEVPQGLLLLLILIGVLPLFFFVACRLSRRFVK